MTIRILLTVLGLSVSLLLAQATEPTTILGVLEEIPGRFGGQPDFRAVRILFQKNGREWRPFPSSCPDPVCLQTVTSQFPSVVTWTIAFSGRSLGQVTGRTPKTFQGYSSIGLQEITSKGPVPTVGKRSSEYGGWIAKPVFRPLVVNSRPFFVDPDSWKPARVSDEVTEVLRREFRRKFPKVSNCTTQDNETAKPWRYPDADIKIIKAYSSKRAWTAAAVLLAGSRCQLPPGDPTYDAFDSQWFAMGPHNEIRFLGQGMWLVDAGDYDNDGRSELVFATAGYNRDGYKLFYEDFKRHAGFEFSYH